MHERGQTVCKAFRATPPFSMGFRIHVAGLALPVQHLELGAQRPELSLERRERGTARGMRRSSVAERVQRRAKFPQGDPIRPRRRDMYAGIGLSHTPLLRTKRTP